MSIELANERVAEGVALLDENIPGWADEIDLDELRMDDPSHCVLGQTFGRDNAAYTHGLHALGISDDVSYGFECDEFVSFEELDEAWSHAIDAHIRKTTYQLGD